MQHPSFDIAIFGAGMVGLMAAVRLASTGFSVALIDPKPPQTSWESNDLPLRVSAINHASLQAFTQLSLRDDILPSATPYRRMRVWDAGSDGNIHFDAFEMGLPQLGQIIENRAIIAALWHTATNHPKINTFVPNTCQRLNRLNRHWKIQLASEQQLSAKLIIGADGANSCLRTQQGIDIDTTPYEQTAIVGVVETEKPHAHTAYQRFLTTGPLALLPLTNTHHCSFVWSIDDDAVADINALSDEAFSGAMTKASESCLGTLQIKTARPSFPLIARHAETYTQPGLALIGDAAHTIHPLAGLGVNLGFADVDSLVACLSDAADTGRPIDTITTLGQYERDRRKHNQLTLWLMRAFKNCFSTDQSALAMLRGLGLNITQQQDVVKHFFIKQAANA